MKSFLIFMFLTFFIQSNTYANGHSISWSRDMGAECVEWDENGQAYMFVPRDVCRKLQPTYYDWSKDIGAKCAEWTPDNFAIRIVPNAVCRKIRPTHFRLSGEGICAEWTPEEFAIQIVAQKNCFRR